MKFKNDIDFVDLDIELINSDEKFAVYYRNNKPTNYAISTEGRVYNMKTKTLRKTWINNNQYRTINLSFGSSNDMETCFIHRMVAETFLDGRDPENGVDVVDHINGPWMGNSIYNLEWVTHQENLRRASENGWLRRKNHLIGENAPGSKYTEEQVRRACEMKSNDIDHKTISNETGISYNYLGKIFNGLKWGHIVKEYDLESKNKHFYPKEMHERVVDLVLKGFSNKSIRKIIFKEYGIELKKSYVKDIKRRDKKCKGSTTIESELVVEILREVSE